MQDVFEKGFADRSKDIFNFSRDMIAAFVTMSIILERIRLFFSFLSLLMSDAQKVAPFSKYTYASNARF